MSERKVVARNRAAWHDYEILEKFEAGLALLGPEVKSIRASKASITEAYAVVKEGEATLIDMHVPPYSHAGYAVTDPKRPRRLLLHRREIRKLEDALARRGLTIVPLELYFREGRAKIELALARGRKKGDKRETLRREADTQEARRALRRPR